MEAIIYQITNRNNGKRYVGFTTKTLERRFNEHVWCAEHDSQYHLHRAMRKHGKQNFSIKALEITTSEIAGERETFYVSILKPEYNMTAGGDGGQAGTIWITDGKQQRRILASIEIPEGFVRGMNDEAKTRAKAQNVDMWTPELRERLRISRERPCTVDGITIFRSRTHLKAVLGQGKTGSRSPHFRHV